MKEEKLTVDEYDALDHIRRGAKHDRVNACVGRNAKRLAGLKMIQYGRDGKLEITDKGTQVLFLRRCIGALEALVAQTVQHLEPDIAQFLVRKSHVVELAGGGFAVTDKGRESLADIVSQNKQK